LSRVRVGAATVLAGVLAACGTSVSPAPSGDAAPTAAVFEENVDVGGGRTIQIVCAGPTDSGRPTIVFENGAGPTLVTWRPVMNAATLTDRACAYNRAGVGQSDDPPGPRTTRDQVADLAAALAAAGVTGPIVLVAHSRGGWNAIVYTADHPEQVAGLVLVDIAPPGLELKWLAELGPEQPGEPDHIAEARDIFTNHPGDPSVDVELLDLEASAEEALRAPGFGDRPTEILWATETDIDEWPGFDPGLADRLNRAYAGLQESVEDRADDPNVTLVDTGHAIHEERPAVVVEAIGRVLAALQDGATS
jgi:pimeloyl-ACP methyl ester carboxylesterase